ncbi:MAG: site-specific integrase [Phycisphaerales bacterium]|nr:MAG: site-specific integrase [Phycisphaerales bacterium]
MSELVRLRTRPSRDGKRFVYMLDHLDENGKRKRISLGHADKRKAEKQRAQRERELRMGIVVPGSMKLSDFLEDSLNRTGQQTRDSTQYEQRSAMKQFIKLVGDIDYQRVTLAHGELFRQSRLDKGNSPATVSKKVRALKRLFALAVERKQLQENPFRYLRPPKWRKTKIEVYKPDECERLLRIAHEDSSALPWDVLIYTAIITGMRRGELLNLVWADVDFEAKQIHVSPKANTPETWQWLIKDTDRRILPLTDEAVFMLAEHQARQPDKYAYVFVPPQRYKVIQELRKQGKWTLSDARLKVINNFRRKYERIQKGASVRVRRFHDLRNTAITNWFANGLNEYEVMKLAGHATFETTHQFYLAVADDLVDRARAAASAGVCQNLARIWHAPAFSSKGD